MVRLIAEELSTSPSVVQAITLGSHGDSMVALPRHATVDGRPLPELVDERLGLRMGRLLLDDFARAGRTATRNR